MIRPLYDQVVVRLLEAEQTTLSGIVLAPTAQANELGEVVAVGNGYLQDGMMHPLTVEVGDTVMFKRLGQQIKIDGETLYVFREQEFIGILPSDDVEYEDEADDESDEA